MLTALIVVLILAAWLVSRKLNSYKNESAISLGLDLEEKKREKRMWAIKNQVALRHALDKGIDPNSFSIEQLVEQYRQDVAEEGISAAIKEFGISRDEAISQGFDKGGSLFVHLESKRRNRSKELGREVSWKESLDMDKEALVNSKYPGLDCWQPWEVESYIRGEELTKSRASHLESCDGCHMMVSCMTPDPELQKPPGPDCINEKEVEDIQNRGFLPKDRREHLTLCKRCKSNVYAAQEKFIERVAPRPTPWGLGALD